MIGQPPCATRTHTVVPYTTLFISSSSLLAKQSILQLSALRKSDSWRLLRRCAPRNDGENEMDWVQSPGGAAIISVNWHSVATCPSSIALPSNLQMVRFA